MDDWETRCAKSLAVRRQNALAHALAIDATLATAIADGTFDWVDRFNFATLSLSYLTTFLRVKGHKSSTGTTLSATGVMRALALLGTDWQSYCVMIAERSIEVIKPKHEEADFIGPDSWVETPAPMPENTKTRAQDDNRRRNIRWVHYVSPARMFEMTGRDDVDFNGWLDERYSLCGQRFSFNPDERENLIPTFLRWHYEKYGAHLESYVQPEFFLRTRRRSQSKRSQSKRQVSGSPLHNDGWMTEDFYNDYLASHA